MSTAVPVRLWRLARPAGMPLLLALPTLGYLFALWDWALPWTHPGRFAAVLAAWSLLSAGALWLNAVLDRDDEPVLMAPDVPARELPEGLWGYGLAALAGAVAVAGMAGPWPLALAGLCAALAVGYSHPDTAWKGHPIGGPLVNLVGYGVATPAAGWVVAEAAPTRRTLLTAICLLAWVGATYFGAQAFQQAADAARGYRTLVVTHGPRATIAVARALFAVAIGGLMLGGAFGWYPRTVLATAASWVWLDVHLATWARAPEAGVGAARTMLRRATVVALTVLGAVTTAHVHQLALGEPPGGMGTAWRPSLP